MRVQILGPLRLWDGADWLPIRAAQQRVVLAVLLIRAGRAVSADQLVDEIWGERPPRAALSTLQGYVMRLRRVLGKESLITRDRGYELAVEPSDLDARIFESLAAAGRHEEALALWQGAALADVPPSPVVMAAAEH